jgi:hypothetical protein
MTWLAWRQFRTQVVVIAAVLALLAIVLIPTGLHIRDLYDSCRATHSCDSSQLTNTYAKLQNGLQALLLVAPALIGIFWGAPLVARELETGTYRLGWTQSVSRRRWLAVKLGVGALASVAAAGVLSLLATWWFSPIDTVNRQIFGTLDVRDIAPIGYAAFAFALGATLGLLMRRLLPAMAVTLVGFVAARLAVTFWVRPHLIPPLHATLPLTSSGTNIGFSLSPSGGLSMFGGASVPNALVTSSSIVNASGQSPSSQFLTRACPDLGNPAVPPPGASSGAVHIGIGHAVKAPVGPSGFQSCIDHVAAKYHLLVSYQPANRYWAFQGLETALFVVVALLLVGASFWWLRHRIA